MAICKECVHNEVCKYGEKRSNGMYCTEEKCKQFKDSTNYVEVVRCRDCKEFHRADDRFEQHCRTYGAMVGEDDFCSYGERREGNV